MKLKQTKEKIRETHFVSPLGVLKIVADNDGIRSISFAEESEILSSNNSLHPVLQHCVDELREYFLGQNKTIQTLNLTFLFYRLNVVD